MINATGVIFYRFGSERGIWRELQLDCTGGILVSELKILIAQETSLSKDFTRKTNLMLSLYDDNASKMSKPLEDNVVVHLGSRIIINRVAWSPVKPIYHEAKTQFGAEVVEEKNLRPFPISLICKLCALPMKAPVLVKCSASCGCSGCRECLMSYFKDCVIKAEDDSDAIMHTLSERRNCPFCMRGYVSAFVNNRQMEAVLMELDFSNFEIPSLDASAEETTNEQHSVPFEDFAVTPKHFLVCIDNALIDVIRENMLLPGYIDSRISSGSTLNHSEGDNGTSTAIGDVFVIVVSYVGGGTSISPMGMVRIIEEVGYNMDFIKSTRAHTAYRFEWVYNNTQPLMVPARRQPLFSHLGAKRYTSVALNADNDVMWRYRNDIMIEVGLKREAFESLFQAIFGIHSDALQKEGDNTAHNKSWLEVSFPNGPPPMYITQKCRVTAQEDITDEDVFDYGNPYLGYLAILPFLSQSQFLKIREVQRRAKEQFLQQLTNRVTEDLPQDKGEPVLERAYNNVWKRHIEYHIPGPEVTGHEGTE